MSTPEVSALVLSQANRPDQLVEALRSIAEQEGVSVETIIGWNGCEPAELPDGLVDRQVLIETNVGIPEGRNRIAEVATAPLLLVLDDDARLVGRDILKRAVRIFTENDRLAVAAMRVVDEEGRTVTRHSPRLGRFGLERAGEVTAFVGCAWFVRASAYEQVGGFPGSFFYSMEETDLSWRLLDAGWSIRYEPELLAFHPRTQPSRHPQAAWRTARNRAWLADRLLPTLLQPVYLTTWFFIALSRSLRGGPSIGSYLRGVRDGWRTRPGPRRPIRWRTVWQMTRIGRPPVI